MLSLFFLCIQTIYEQTASPLTWAMWLRVCACVRVRVSTTSSRFSLLVILTRGYLSDRIWLRVLHTFTLCHLFLFWAELSWAEVKDVPKQREVECCGAQTHMPHQKEGCGCLVGASLSCKWNTTGKWKNDNELKSNQLIWTAFLQLSVSARVDSAPNASHQSGAARVC